MTQDVGKYSVYSIMPITVQASLRLPRIVGCAARTRTGHRTEDARCAWRTLRSLHSNRSYGYGFRSRAARTNTSPHVSPGGEMITPRSGCTKDCSKEWNKRVYCRMSKILCAFKDQVRARPSGGTGGLRPAPASVILVRNAGSKLNSIAERACAGSRKLPAQNIS